MGVRSMSFLTRALGIDAAVRRQQRAVGGLVKAVSMGASISQLAAAAQTPTVTGPANAVGIPAVLSAMRLITETGAMLPVLTYRDTPDGVRVRAVETPTYEMLRRRPAEDVSPVEWLSDVLSALVGYGNFYARKVRVGSGSERRVRELPPIDPRTVRPEWVDGGIVYTVSSGGRTEKLTRRDIFHVRGFTLHGEAAGMSPITACRLALSAGLSMETFLNSFWQNDAQPGGILSIPGTVSTEEADAIIDAWVETHGGPTNKGRPALLSGGAEWKQLGMSLVDAQFVESHRFNVEQAARLLNMPPAFLGTNDVSEADMRFFRLFTLGPYLARINAALTSDQDVCPPGSGLFVEVLTDALLQPDTRERYEAYRAARQGGWVTPNELRRRENLPPVEGGDEIQLTPVGGAPNRPGDGETAAGPTDGGAA